MLWLIFRLVPEGVKGRGRPPLIFCRKYDFLLNFQNQNYLLIDLYPCFPEGPWKFPFLFYYKIILTYILAQCRPFLSLVVRAGSQDGGLGFQPRYQQTFTLVTWMLYCLFGFGPLLYISLCICTFVPLKVLLMVRGALNFKKKKTPM